MQGRSMTRRALAALLSVMMLISLVPLSVFAADTDTKITLSFGETVWTDSDEDLQEYADVAGQKVLVVPIVATSADGSDIDIGAATVQVSFDPEVLSYQDIEDAGSGIISLLVSGRRMMEATGTDPEIANADGFVNAVFANTARNNFPVASGDPIAKIVFRAGSATDAETTISFDEVQLRVYDADKEAQAYTDVETSDPVTAPAYDGGSTPEPETTYAVTVNGGTLVGAPEDGKYAKDAEVSIKADDPESGKKFKEWTSADGVTFADATKAETTFKMPDKAVTVTAAYEDDATEPEPETTYAVTVNGGTLVGAPEDGKYAKDAEVSIKADDPESGKKFKEWTSADGVTFADATKSETTFKMLDKAVTVTATYEDDTTTPGSDGTDPGSEPTPGSDGGKSGGCYIATSVYGSYDAPEVWTLRRFRDEVLADTWYGRLFIKTYYAVSPTLVRLFGDTDLFQGFWRGQLDTMVGELQDAGFEASPYQDIDW